MQNVGRGNSTGQLPIDRDVVGVHEVAHTHFTGDGLRRFVDATIRGHVGVTVDDTGGQVHAADVNHSGLSGNGKIPADGRDAAIFDDQRGIFQNSGRATGPDGRMDKRGASDQRRQCRTAKSSQRIIDLEGGFRGWLVGIVSDRFVGGRRGLYRGRRCRCRVSWRCGWWCSAGLRRIGVGRSRWWSSSGLFSPLYDGGCYRAINPEDGTNSRRTISNRGVRFRQCE